MCDAFIGLASASCVNAATWCGGTEITDVICYKDGNCYITAENYGGRRYYKIESGSQNKELIVSTALAVLSTKGKARIAFQANDLNCSDVPQREVIFGVGATRFYD